MIGAKTIESLTKIIEEAYKKELRDQGHYLTGKLEQSIKVQFAIRKNKATLETLAESYWLALEEGIPGSHISETNISGLTRFAKLRFGLDERAAAKVALKIARKHRREGMPTASSYQFSKTGERTFAAAEAYNRAENQIKQKIDAELNKEYSKEFDEKIGKIKF